MRRGAAEVSRRFHVPRTAQALWGLDLRDAAKVWCPPAAKPSLGRHRQVAWQALADAAGGEDTATPELRRMLCLGLVGAQMLLAPSSGPAARVAGTPAVRAPRPAVRASTWSLQQQAAALQRAGEPDRAAPIWERLLRRLAPQRTAAAATNEAIYSGDLGRYWLGRRRFTRAVALFDQEAHFWALAGHPAWGVRDETVASHYRVVVRAYLRSTAAAAGVGGRYAPTRGTYLGLFAGPGSVRGLPVRGDGVRPPPIEERYLGWGRIPPAAELASPGALELSLQPMGGLPQVLSGADYVRQLAAALARARGPVFLRFAPEMNGDWTPWGMVPARTPAFRAHAAAYVRAFRLVATIMHRMAPRVAMVWAPADKPAPGTEQYWPGRAYVDWVGVSIYLDWSHPGQPGANRLGNPLADLTWVYSHYGTVRPIMVTEGAVGHRDVVTGQERTSWAAAEMRDLFAGLPLLYPDVKAWVWWSADDPGPTGGGSDYRLTPGGAATRSFAAATASPWYLKSWGATAPFAYRPFGGAIGGPRVVAAYVHFWQLTSGAVTYEVDGRAIGTARQPPYPLRYNFGLLPPGAHRLEVVVRDRNGAVVATAAFPFRVPPPGAPLPGGPPRP